MLALGLSGIVWVLAWRPSVMVADDAVTVRNPLRDVRIAWPALDDAGFDWALWLRAGNVTCRAAAAPGPASMGALYDRGRSKTGIYERHAVKTVGHSLPPALFAVRQRWVGQTHDGPADVHVTRPWVSIIMLTVSIIVVAGAGLLA